MKTSLIITTFNRASLLERSLERLTNLTVPDEIVVVNDGGTDNTVEVVESFGKRLPIRYIYNNNPGKTICSHARNVGLKEVDNEWVITCEPEVMYVTDMVERFKNLHDQYDNDVISAGKVWFCPKGYHPNPQNPEPKGKTAIGWVAPYTALWNKNWLEEVGGWDEEFPGDWGWEDIDLLTRLRINRHGQHIDTDSEVLHQWHELGGDKDQTNENHFRSKSFIDKGDESKFGEEELYDVVANRNHEWGIKK